MRKLNLRDPEQRFIFDMILLLTAELLWATGIGFYSTLFPVYIKNFIPDERIISLIMSIGRVTGLLALVGGLLTKKFNLKWVAFWCWGITLPAPLIFALSDSWPGFLVGQLIYNCTTIFAPAVMLYIYEHPGHGNKTGAFMLFSATTMLAGIIGPAIGGALSEALGMRTVLFISFGMACLGASFLLFLSPVRPRENSRAQVLSTGKNGFKLSNIGSFIRENRRCILWILLLSTITPGYNLTGSILGIHVSSLGFNDAQIGLGYSTSAALGISLSLIVQRWGGKYTPLAIIAVMGISAITANVLVLIPACITVMIPLGVGLRGTGRVSLPYIQATLTESLGVEDKGMFIGGFIALRTLFELLALMVGGTLYKASPELPFIAEGIYGAVWILLFAAFTKNRRASEVDIGPVGAAARRFSEQ